MAGKTAASGFVVEVTDLGDIRSALRRLDRALPREILPAAHKRAARAVVLPIAKREAPTGPTGRLKASTRVLATQTKVRLAAGYARLVYAPIIYWGWPGHNIAPNPWLDRAVSVAGPRRIREAASREIASGLNRVRLAHRRN